MQHNCQSCTVRNMMSFSPAPIFSGSWDHRPAVSSPLSSSPVRASSPLSPIDRNVCPQRQIQSSPIKPPKFKFSSRPTRPNPVNKKRDELHEGRRKVFLQNVRQSREDKAWQRRDIEGQVGRHPSCIRNVANLIAVFKDKLSCRPRTAVS